MPFSVLSGNPAYTDAKLMDVVVLETPPCEARWERRFSSHRPGACAPHARKKTPTRAGAWRWDTLKLKTMMIVTVRSATAGPTSCFFRADPPPLSAAPFSCSLDTRLPRADPPLLDIVISVLGKALFLVSRKRSFLDDDQFQSWRLKSTFESLFAPLQKLFRPLWSRGLRAPRDLKDLPFEGYVGRIKT